MKPTSTVLSQIRGRLGSRRWQLLSPTDNAGAVSIGLAFSDDELDDVVDRVLKPVGLPTTIVKMARWAEIKATG